MATDADGDIEMNSETQIDENLYSRQIFVMGKEAMIKMQSANVLIVGMNGVGVEIAKNVILAGVKSVSILDNSPAIIGDLSSQFYLKEENVGQPRAPACVAQLKELNRYVPVDVVTDPLTPELLGTNRWKVVVLVNSPLQEQIDIDRFCRANGIYFISTCALGVFGSVFCDFGEGFQITDTNGENPMQGLVTHISKENPGVVTVHEDHRHGMETGDFVTFEEVQGMTALNGSNPRPIKVLTPFSFSIEDTSGLDEYQGEGMFFQVKQPSTMSFPSLEEQLNEPELMFTDFGKDPAQRHIFYRAVQAFAAAHGGAFPNPTSKEESDAVVQIAKELAGDTEVDEKLVFNLARASSGVVAPMAALLGGVVGQEVLKACTGKFTPIRGCWYVDAVEAIPAIAIDGSDGLDISDFAPRNTRYDQNIAVFGRSLQDAALNARYFLVGSGAIGCEMLKNWAMMGVGCGDEGQITVTDMDQIETSNLNRQFLFRPRDVGQPKSTTAARVAQEMNPGMKIDAHMNRVGPDSENVYNDDFWTNLTGVCTALDNVQARLYVDSQCINYGKPMLESGTLGTKGNTQVVVPFLTESYGSQRDPPEAGIPICTLKNFPNKISHTIQWARDRFEGAFTGSPNDVNSYLSQADFLTELAKDSSSEMTTLRTLKAFLVDERPLRFDDCVAWARRQFQTDYHNSIRQLLHNFPKDSTTRDGTKFWSGPKRAPEPITFDPRDPTHVEYVVSGANLRAQIFGLQGSRDVEMILNMAMAVEIPEWEPKNVKIAVTDEEAKEQKDNAMDVDDYDVEAAGIKSALPEPSSLAGFQLVPLEFEKDDDTNFHMDFITAASNLRARNYNIKEANKLETKGIAGKIIPAIATTTALVTGLISFEFYKLLQGREIEAYRNTFVNLAIPLFAMSEPVPCAKQTVVIKGGREWAWSLWDKIEINGGASMTLGAFIEYFTNEYGLELNMLSYGPAILYAFFHPPKKIAKRSAMTLVEVIETVIKSPVDPGTPYLLFEVSLSNENDEDVEVPTVKVRL